MEERGKNVLFLFFAYLNTKTKGTGDLGVACAPFPAPWPRHIQLISDVMNGERREKETRERKRSHESRKGERERRA